MTDESQPSPSPSLQAGRGGNQEPLERIDSPDQTDFRFAESGLIVSFHPLTPSVADWADLTAGEHDRAKRYAIDRIRNQFVAVRSELRRQLAHWLNCQPVDVPITVRPDGKPIVTGEPIHFNVAHSGDLAAIALADRPVGIDLEQIRDVPNAWDLLKRYFSAREFEQYESLPDDLKVEGFFRGWTCKEAVLKGDGRGMRVVDRCEICLDPREPPQVVAFPESSEDWLLRAWSPHKGYACAVAIPKRKS